jgi:hypothetical protein
LLAASGVLFGVTASMRFVAAALLAPAVVVVASGAVSGPGRGRRFGARLAAVAGGLAITTAAVAGLSGQAPWSWSRYDYWTPRWYADLGDTFRLDYALAGNPDYTLPKGVEPFSHLAFAAEVLLGLPGRPAMSSLGRWWPILGWLGLGWAAWRLSRSGRPVERSCGRAAAALAAWSAGHVVLYSTYFCAYPRFYLGPLAACLLGLVVPVALWAGSGARWRWGGAAAAALLLVAVTADAGRGLPAAPATRAPAPQVRRAFADWLALGDDGRRDRAMPFDPVHAQALGLVTPEVVAGVGEWGRLPLVGHVARLRATGAIAADEVLPVERGGG